MLSLTAVGAVLPVIPRYVRGPLDSGDVAVGVAVGAFAITALASRPLAGYVTDLRGRRPVVVVGALLAAVAGLLYLVPAGLAGLIGARLVLGAGEGMVFTAGATWVVDLAPPDRRGRVIGLYGLAVWGGLSLGPPIGDALLRASSYEAVWAFSAICPFLGALVALRIPDRHRPPSEPQERPLLALESVRPGIGISLASVGFAAMASFIVLHLEAQGSGNGATVFTAFAATVVLTRLIGGDLPDRIGPLRCAAGAAVLESAALALIALAEGLPLALAGAIGMGMAFALLYPSLSLVAINERLRVTPRLGARDLHRLLRHRHRHRRRAHRPRRSAGRLPGSLLARLGLRGGDRIRGDAGTGPRQGVARGHGAVTGFADGRRISPERGWPALETAPRSRFRVAAARGAAPGPSRREPRASSLIGRALALSRPPRAMRESRSCSGRGR